MALKTIAELNAWRSGFPALIGFEVTSSGPGKLGASMPITKELLAPNGYLHAASVVGLADTACGFATMADLPDGATGFTTIELKSNFLGTALEGVLLCEAVRMHNGKSTQVWDAVVTLESTGRTLALFRCTQMVLYRR